MRIVRPKVSTTSRFWVLTLLENQRLQSSKPQVLVTVKQERNASFTFKEKTFFEARGIEPVVTCARDEKFQNRKKGLLEM
mgnify:CR=1 FL=1